MSPAVTLLGQVRLTVKYDPSQPNPPALKRTRVFVSLEVKLKTVQICCSTLSLSCYIRTEARKCYENSVLLIHTTVFLDLPLCDPHQCSSLPAYFSSVIFNSVIPSWGAILSQVFVCFCFAGVTVSSILMKEAPGSHGLISSNKKCHLGGLHSNMTLLCFCMG